METRKVERATDFNTKIVGTHDVFDCDVHSPRNKNKYNYVLVTTSPRVKRNKSLSGAPKTKGLWQTPLIRRLLYLNRSYLNF